MSDQQIHSDFEWWRYEPYGVPGLSYWPMDLGLRRPKPPRPAAYIAQMWVHTSFGSYSATPRVIEQRKDLAA